MNLQKKDGEQAEAQRLHTERAGGNILPRDLKIGGRTYTQLFRSHPKGGRIVMLENSSPGRATGHRFVVFKSTSKTAKKFWGNGLPRFRLSIAELSSRRRHE